MIYKSFFFIIFTALFFNVYSQTDTVYEYVYDTLYVPDTIKNTVEIIQYEYIDEPLSGSFSLSAGTGAGADFSKVTNTLTSSNEIFATVPLLLRIERKQLFFQTGISFRSAGYNYPREEQFTTINSYNVTETVIIDTIYKEVDGVLVPEVYSREETSTVTDTVITDTVLTAKAPMRYYSIPVFAGYSRQLNNFTIRLAGGISIAFFDTKSYKRVKEQYSNMKRSFYSFGGAASLAYSFNQNFSVEAGLTSLWQAGSQSYSLQSNAITISVFYHFF